NTFQTPLFYSYCYSGTFPDTQFSEGKRTLSDSPSFHSQRCRGSVPDRAVAPSDERRRGKLAGESLFLPFHPFSYAAECNGTVNALFLQPVIQVDSVR